VSTDQYTCDCERRVPHDTNTWPLEAQSVTSIIARVGRPQRWYRVFNEAPALLLIAIVILAVVKPWWSLDPRSLQVTSSVPVTTMRGCGRPAVQSLSSSSMWNIRFSSDGLQSARTIAASFPAFVSPQSRGRVSPHPDPATSNRNRMP
jgi:hypothetical protein